MCLMKTLLAAWKIAEPVGVWHPQRGLLRRFPNSEAAQQAWCCCHVNKYHSIREVVQRTMLEGF